MLRRYREDRGYAVVMTALVLVPLMGFAGFAVDVGAWYARASELQRAADAASLAGVVWQPDFTEAENAARAEAARNGFIHGVDGIEVNVTDTGNNQLEVQIIDTDADTFFAGLFLDDVAIGRQAVSEYVESVPLGSPESRFGTGTETWTGFSATNFNAALSGYCTSKDMGDQIMVAYEWIGWGGCTTPDPLWDTNEDYDANGYWYAIEKADGMNEDILVNIFDVGTCEAVATDIDDIGGSSPAGAFNTVWTLHEADNTPINDFDNPVYATFTSVEGGSCGTWDTIFTIPGAGRTGRWYLNVRTNAADAAIGHNLYGIWAQRASDTTPCSTLSDSSCPQMFAIERMGVLVDQPGVATGDFFLAEIDDVHAGKQMKVSLWDTADGMDYLQILDPNGSPVSFTFETSDGVYSGSNDTCSGQPCLDVDPGGSAIYNGRLLELVIDLPTAATFAGYPDNWWNIFYQASGSNVWDRTTWGVEILGDPVRLLE
ncbi:MAG: Tad domain-containing protein [Actinomycetota bacterium]